MMRFKLWLVVIMVMLFWSSAYAAPNYPSELAKVVKKYPNGEVHMTSRKGNEVYAAVLAKGVTERRIVFDFYQQVLGGKGWDVESEMDSPMMSVMNFTKDGILLIVGLMDHKQPQNEGIMITLTLRSGQEISPKEVVRPKPQPKPKPQLQPQPQPQGDYQDNKNGTVTQLSTNLIWQQADDGKKRSWHKAVSYCNDLSLGSSTDWRLPERNELAGFIISPEVSTKPDFYWADTDRAPGSILSWSVGFSESGSGSKEHNKAMKHYVRCVRDGS